MLDMIIDWSGMAFVLAIVIYFIWVSYKEMKAREKRYAEEAERDRERSKKQEEASKRYKEFQEVTDWVEKATKRCLLDELEAISRGEKRRLSSFALQAAEIIRARQGGYEHPDNVKQWEPIFAELSGEIEDAEKIHDQFNYLLHPGALEDVNLLKRQFKEGMNRLAAGEKPEASMGQAAKALNRLRERDLWKQREEEEEAKEERRLEEEKDRKFMLAMQEMTDASLKNILRMYELPPNSFDGIPLGEIVGHLRNLHKLSPEERQEYIAVLQVHKSNRQCKSEHTASEAKAGAKTDARPFQPPPKGSPTDTRDAKSPPNFTEAGKALGRIFLSPISGTK
jgi:hypothetical protein